MFKILVKSKIKTNDETIMDWGNNYNKNNYSSINITQKMKKINIV